MANAKELASLSRELQALKRQVKAMQAASRLQNARIRNTGIPVEDDDGNLVEVIGRQADGSFGDRIVRSGPQPRPTGLSVEPGTGTMSVEWDGSAESDSPLVFGKIRVMAAPGEDAEFSQARHVSSIYSREGGATTVRVTSGTWTTWLVMVGADGATVSEPSKPERTYIQGVVDQETIRERLEELMTGDWDDAAYASLMARLGEFLSVKAGQVEADALDGLIITGAVVQTSSDDDRGIKFTDEGIVGYDEEGRVLLFLDGQSNRIQGTVTLSMGDEGTMGIRDWSASEIFKDADEDAGQDTYWGLGFTREGNPASGLFMRNGGVNLVAGTGDGRPRGWISGEWAAQSLAISQQFAPEPGCRIGEAPISLNLLNGWRVSNHVVPPAYTIFGDMIILRGGVRTPSGGDMGAAFGFIPESPSEPVRLTTARTGDTGGDTAVLVIEVGTDGNLRVLNGSSQTLDRTVQLDGLFFYRS